MMNILGINNAYAVVTANFWKIRAYSAEIKLQNDSKRMTWTWNWDDSNWVCSYYWSKLTDISNDTWNFVPNSWIFRYIHLIQCNSSVILHRQKMNRSSQYVCIQWTRNSLFRLLGWMYAAENYQNLVTRFYSITRSWSTSVYISDKLWNWVSTWRVFNVAYKLFWQGGWSCKN